MNGSRARFWGFVTAGGVVLVLLGVMGPKVYGAFSLLNRGDEIDFGGREMFVLCQGSGSPTILLEHGLGSSGTEWQAVQDELAETNLVCARSRAGMGFSDAISDGSTQTAQHAVDDLEMLLVAADIPGPYVLVGHSFGGYVVRLYADQHPEDVVGMVLVDSTHEDQVQLLQRRLSAASWSEVAGLFEADNPEHMDFEASTHQVARTTPLGDLPLVVLEADHQQTDAGAAEISAVAAAEIDSVMRQLWPELQVDLAALSTVGRHVRVKASGHFIQIDNPGAVVDAIRSTSE